MNLARHTVARPIFTCMATLIALTLGAIALQRLPIDLMPEITYPTLSIVSDYGNAGPQEMEQLVTRPIEEAVSAVPGVEEIASTSAEGASVLRVSFVWGTDLDVATNDIRDRLDRISKVLPEDMERPQIRKFDVASFPILVLGVSSRLDPTELRQLVDDQISYRLERTPGVAAVDIWGGLEREIHVDLKASKIEALGLSLEQIRTAIQDANITVSAGEIERGNMNLPLRTPGEFTNLDQIRNTVIATQDGAPIYLAQIADVVDTHMKQTRIIRINGAPGIRMGISKQSGANTVQVAEDLKREVRRLAEDFPQINIVPIMDTSRYIQRAIGNVTQSIFYGGALAVLVLLFFLRDVRATLVVATAIPISIIATFVLIYFGGFTLNLMTLGGLALGVGMMVDNAIVVIENITRVRQEKGHTGVSAAIEGTRQVSAAVVASTLTTVVIFLPIVFTQDLTSVMFRPFAYVVSFSMICSLAVSLTLVPMLASRLADASGGHASRKSRLRRSSEWCLQKLEAVYLGLLDAALRWRWHTLLLAFGVLLGSISLVPHIGGEFMPATDEAEVEVNVEMEPGTRLAVLNERMRIIEALVHQAVPEAVASVTNVGAPAYRGGAAEGDIKLALLPSTQRVRSSAAIADDLRGELEHVPGVQISASEGGGLYWLGGSSGDSLEIIVRGYDLATVNGLAKAVEAELKEVEGINEVDLSREARVPQQIFSIDRERAADLGVSVSQIASALETALAGSSAGQYRDGGSEFRILVRLQNAERLALESILNLTVRNDQGQQVVLRNLVVSKRARGPTQIGRLDQQRAIQIYADVTGRDLNSIVNDIRGRLRQIPTPRDTEIIISGDYEEQQKAFRDLLLSLVLALALVYMVMACLYESLLDPLIVMFTVPLAAIGVLLALYLTDTTFNVQSFIGCIMLVGIVVTNAILIVDQAGQRRRAAQLNATSAVRVASRDRLRPILMTCLATILGLLPLALGIGEGAEAQAPLARVVIGGLLSSTLITLVVIPVLYSLMHRDGPTHALDPSLIESNLNPVTQVD